MATFAVMGATGNIGSRISEQLLATGHAVRALGRSLEKLAALKTKGAEVLTGHAADAAFLTKAFTGETDAVFRTSDPVTLHDPVLGRRLVVTTQGASNLVVWTPWEAKAAAIDDLPDDDWTRFVCIEGANALENAVPLEPGESHTTTYRLAVEAL